MNCFILSQNALLLFGIPLLSCLFCCIGAGLIIARTGILLNLRLCILFLHILYQSRSLPLPFNSIPLRLLHNTILPLNLLLFWRSIEILFSFRRDVSIRRRHVQLSQNCINIRFSISNHLLNSRQVLLLLWRLPRRPLFSSFGRGEHL